LGAQEPHLEELLTRSLPRLATCAAISLLAGCAQDAPTTPAGPRAANDASAPAETIYHEQFTRTAGAPDAFSRTISTADFDGPFTLTIENGGTAKNTRVSSASLAVDGTSVLSPDDFSKQSGSWTLSPTLGPSASLELSLAGSPGSYLTVTITGYRHVLHVCPGVDGAYQTIGDAVADAPSGATIKLCDGQHIAESVAIDEPLTILPEDGAHPVVVNASTTGALVIGGTASGTVRISGIAFANNAGPRNNSARLLGSFSVRQVAGALNLSVSGSSFTTTTAGNGGIAFANTSAMLDVSGSSFTGGLFGIYTDAASSVAVHGSNFTHHDNFGARLGAASVLVENSTADHCNGTCWVAVGANPARIINNTAVHCGTTACASASGSVAEIAGNNFSSRVNPSNNGGAHNTILFFSGTSGTIANNVIDGCGYGECITVFETHGQLAEIANNSITVYVGDRTRMAIIAGDGTFGNSPRTDLGATAYIHDNTVTVSGTNNPAAAPADTNSWAMMYSVIHVEGHSTARIDRNSGTNAQQGIGIRTGSHATGTDNRFDLNRVGISLNDAGSTADIHRSDFTNTIERSFGVAPGTSGSATCNYWGSSAGPLLPGNPLGTAFWSPFSTAPIAGTTISCP
jgi:hypothetical protein